MSREQPGYFPFGSARDPRNAHFSSALSSESVYGRDERLSTSESTIFPRPHFKNNGIIDATNLGGFKAALKKCLSEAGVPTSCIEPHGNRIVGALTFSLPVELWEQAQRDDCLGQATKTRLRSWALKYGLLIGDDLTEEEEQRYIFEGLIALEDTIRAVTIAEELAAEKAASDEAAAEQDFQMGGGSPAAKSLGKSGKPAAKASRPLAESTPPSKSVKPAAKAPLPLAESTPPPPEPRAEPHSFLFSRRGVLPTKLTAAALAEKTREAEKSQAAGERLGSALLALSSNYPLVTQHLSRTHGEPLNPSSLGHVVLTDYCGKLDANARATHAIQRAIATSASSADSQAFSTLAHRIGPAQLDQTLLNEIKCGKIGLHLTPYERIYGGFNVASALFDVLVAYFTPLPSPNPGLLVDAIRALRIDDPSTGTLLLSNYLVGVHDLLNRAAQAGVDINSNNIARALIRRGTESLSCKQPYGPEGHMRKVMDKVHEVQAKVDARPLRSFTLDEMHTVIAILSDASAELEVYQGRYTKGLNAESGETGFHAYVSRVDRDLGPTAMLALRGEQAAELPEAEPQVNRLVGTCTTCNSPRSGCNELYCVLSSLPQPGAWRCLECAGANAGNYNQCYNQCRTGCSGRKETSLPLLITNPSDKSIIDKAVKEIKLKHYGKVEKGGKGQKPQAGGAYASNSRGF